MTVDAAAAKAGRSAALDLLKTALVVGMIGAHVIQLVGNRFLPAGTIVYADFINLVTFSGFLFALGLGMGLSSGASKQRSLLDRIRPAALLLGATYISSIAFIVLVDRLALDGQRLYDVLTLSRLFGWSEFLASFFVLYIVTAIARPLLMRVAAHIVPLTLACLLCLATTYLTSSEDWPFMATLIGTRNFASFPLLPYLPWFLVGIAIGQNGGKLTPWHAVLALAVTVATYAYGLYAGRGFERFPPEIGWITSPAAYVMLYYGIARWLASALPIPSWLKLPGRHVLSFLLLSNLIIFGIRYMFDRPVRDVTGIVLLTGIILLAIGLFWLIVERWRHVPSPPHRGHDAG